MLRFISHLLGIQFEPCKGCEVLRQQLAIANDEKRDLTNTLLNILKPKTYEAAPVELAPIKPHYVRFTRQREALEEAARAKAASERSIHIAKPDKADVDKLEEELGVKEDAG